MLYTIDRNFEIIVNFSDTFSAGWARNIHKDANIKIVNGTYAYPGQFPYTVAIQVRFMSCIDDLALQAIGYSHEFHANL